MMKNVGSFDKIFRIIIAFFIAAAGYYYQSWWGLLAIIPLMTAFMGVCPAYLPFGLSTCKIKEKN